jgi:hypothetical protein
MSSIATTLLNSLRSVERPGDFCIGGIRAAAPHANRHQEPGSYERRAKQRREDLEHVSALGG